VSASFKLGVDFLISWQPYHYSATASLDIHASWWAFHTHAYAKLSIWGPPFGGYAKVHWTVISFEVEFGTLGWPYPKAVGFTEFCNNFLPQSSGITNIAPTIAVSKGQIEEHSLSTVPANTNDSLPLINPKHLEIRVDTVVPVMSLNKLALSGVNLGCAPMNVGTLDDADLSFSVIDKSGNDANHHFKVETFPKNVPQAMWGSQMSPSLDKGAMIEACGGITLSPAALPVMPEAESIKRKDCAYDIYPEKDFDQHVSAASPTPGLTVVAGKSVKEALHGTSNPQALKNRSSVLKVLSLSPEKTVLSESIDKTYRVDPVCVRIS